MKKKEKKVKSERTTQELSYKKVVEVKEKKEKFTVTLKFFAKVSFLNCCFDENGQELNQILFRRGFVVVSVLVAKAHYYISLANRLAAKISCTGRIHYNGE